MSVLFAPCQMTLATLSTDSRPEAGIIPTQHGLPTGPIPMILPARLAIDSTFQRQGLGAKTLVTALRQARALSQSGLPAYGLILDVLDEQALGFYNSFEVFQVFTDDSVRLFVGMKTIADL
jgi:GNAT superfamily N-acetyltransferase